MTKMEGSGRGLCSGPLPSSRGICQSALALALPAPSACDPLRLRSGAQLAASWLYLVSYVSASTKSRGPPSLSDDSSLRYPFIDFHLLNPFNARRLPFVRTLRSSGKPSHHCAPHFVPVSR